jgi:hypothetical protein
MSFPESIKTFTTKVDLRDTVLALHVNELQTEVTAIERSLGTSLVTGTPGVVYNPNITSWTTELGGLGGRLANIEAGLSADAHSQYIRKAADATNIVTPTSGSTIGLKITAHPSQTVNLLEVGGASVSAIGLMRSEGVEVVTLSKAQTLTNKAISGTDNTLSAVPATVVLVDPSTNIKTYVDVLPRVVEWTPGPTGPPGFVVDGPDHRSLGVERPSVRGRPHRPDRPHRINRRHRPDRADWVERSHRPDRDAGSGRNQWRSRCNWSYRPSGSAGPDWAGRSHRPGRHRRPHRSLRPHGTPTDEDHAPQHH